MATDEATSDDPTPSAVPTARGLTPTGPSTEATDYDLAYAELMEATPTPTGGALWRLGIPLALIAASALFAPAMALVIIGLVGLIAAHEAGHLWTARRAGVLASEYSIGIGPVLYSCRRGPTAYTLRLVPVGAFVRVIGMTAAESVPAALEDRTYRRAPLGRRLSIALGGPAANLGLCLVLMFATFTLHGTVDPTVWTTGDVAASSPAGRAGVRSGETVTAVDGTAVATFADMAAAVSALPGRTVELTVTDPTGTSRILPVDLDARVDVYGTVREDLSVRQDGEHVVVTAVAPDGQVAAAGLSDSARITAVAGRPVTDVAAFARAVNDTATNGDITLTIAGRDEPVTVDLGTAVAAQQPRGVVGLTQVTSPQRLGPVQAAQETVTMFTSVTAASVTGIAKFLWPPNMVAFVANAGNAGEITEPTAAGVNVAASDQNRVLSIVGAVQLGSSLVSVSPLTILWFLAVLNLFIGLFNLVPIPPLDGGHVVVALYESVRERLAGDGRRYLANPKLVSMAATAFAAILLTVGLVAIWMDIVAPVA